VRRSGGLLSLGRWKLKVEIDPSEISGKMDAPKSKSITIRMMLASIFSDISIRGVEASDDVLRTLEALKNFGVEADVKPLAMPYGLNLILRHPRSLPRKVSAYAGGSATLVRMLAPMAAALGVEVTFDGDLSLRRRPMTGLFTSLKDAGIEVTETKGAGLPFRIRGKLKGRNFSVKGLESSQHVSGFMYALRCLGGGSLTLKDVPSRSYLLMTAWVLGKLSSDVDFFNDGSEVRIEARGNGPFSETAPGDYLISSFYAAAASVTGGTLTVSGLYPQLEFFGDHSIVNVFMKLGIMSLFQENSWRVSPFDFHNSARADFRSEPRSRQVKVPEKKYNALEINLDDSPDMVLSLAPFAAIADISLKGVNRLKFKESDRLSGVMEVMKEFGLVGQIYRDELRLSPGRPVRGHINCSNDHRIAMMASALASLTGGTIEGAECVEKSDPSFWLRYRDLGGKITWRSR